MTSSISPSAGSPLAAQITAAHPVQTEPVNLRPIQEFFGGAELFVLQEGKLNNKPAFVLQPPRGESILLTVINGKVSFLGLSNLVRPTLSSLLHFCSQACPSTVS